MTDCEHHCGNPTYRVLGQSFNTRSWIRWMREHGVPTNQVPLAGGWVRRDEVVNTVTVPCYDWGNAELEKSPSAAMAPDLPADEVFHDQATHIVRDGKPGDFGPPKMREFTSQLNRAPDPFPVSSDCDQDEREAPIGGMSREEYEHRPVRLTGQSVAF